MLLPRWARPGSLRPRPRPRWPSLQDCPFPVSQTWAVALVSLSQGERSLLATFTRAAAVALMGVNQCQLHRVSLQFLLLAVKQLDFYPRPGLAPLNFSSTWKLPTEVVSQDEQPDHMPSAEASPPSGEGSVAVQAEAAGVRELHREVAGLCLRQTGREPSQSAGGHVSRSSAGVHVSAWQVVASSPY